MSLEIDRQDDGSIIIRCGDDTVIIPAPQPVPLRGQQIVPQGQQVMANG